MSTHPRATVAARAPGGELIPAPELERIRCAARSGIAEPAELLAVLDHVAVQDRVIHAIAKRTAEVGTADEQDRVAAALELIDPEAPVHFRIEFDYGVPPSIGTREAVELIREWDLDCILDLATTARVTGGYRARVTATYRGESESWGAGLA